MWRYHANRMDARRRALCIRRTLSRHVTIGTPMVIFAVFTVFWLFLTIGTLLVHYWYSLCRHVTIGTPMVIFCCFDCLLTVFDYYCTNRHRSTKTVPTVYQQCTNRQKQSRDRQNSKNHRCCTNRHMSTQSPPNTQSPAAVSSTLEEWTRTFSRRQQCTVVLELPYSTEFGRCRAAI